MRSSIAMKWFAVMVVGAVIGGLGLVDSAKAATCVVVSAFTDPDATLTDSGPCGEGIGNNDSEADVQAATGDPNWTLVGGVGAPLFLTFTGTTSGDWFIDAAAPADTDFLIVIKDGATSNSFQWVWFDVDTSVGCGNVLFDYCGTWTMYGTGGNIKDISHMSLYSQPGADFRLVPEPATLGLLGATILGLALSRRRQRPF